MRYVGQTSQGLRKRWTNHLGAKTSEYRLARALRKHGRDCFIIEPIGEVPTRNLANEFEAEYIQRYCSLSPNGYNLRLGGNVAEVHPETRDKISKSLIGTNRALGCKHPHTQETKDKIRRSLIGNVRSRRYVHGLERREKTRQISKKLFSPEYMAELRRISWSPEGRLKRKQAADCKFLKTVAWG